MTSFKKESLEALRQRLDLIEVLSPYVPLKRLGTSYKGLCPFHEEKTPSFVVQRGDSHYHCFGCGAHGDAIHFLMTHQKMSFVDAVECLAHRFHIPLEYTEEAQRTGPDKGKLKQALAHACRFYHFYLLHTAEGHEALHYLYNRGIDLPFIYSFQIGLAPKTGGFLSSFLRHYAISQETLCDVGLVRLRDTGSPHPFFTERLMFPIHDGQGEVIGFSGRKYKEETFGGKYINTPETPLFKKSRILFGLHWSRRRIAKERKVLIVEGQIDALRLIQLGLNFTVAGQGTAFGEGQVKELLSLGITQAFLALDSDRAGREATCKIGHLFQKVGVEVRVVELPPGYDPDRWVREEGIHPFITHLRESRDYLSFLVAHFSEGMDPHIPATKHRIVQQVLFQLREWDHPVMVHQSVQRLAHLLQLPSELIDTASLLPSSSPIVPRHTTIGRIDQIDPDRILETDLLRWLLMWGASHPQLIEQIRLSLQPDDFHVTACRSLFLAYCNQVKTGGTCDLLTLAVALPDAESQQLLSQLSPKKIKEGRVEQQAAETLRRLLQRNGMKKRDEISRRLQHGCSDTEALELARQFDQITLSLRKLSEGSPFSYSAPS